MKVTYAIALVVAALLCGCREDSVVFPPQNVIVDDVDPTAGEAGFYLLNSGNMGSNKATLDRFLYATGEYTRNIYSEANPEVPMSLGDVGNDLKIYGQRLWAVINASNKIEVMHRRDAKRIGQVDIPNVRYLAFKGGYAYATSYAGPILIEEDYAQLGYVAKIDTATLEVVGRCLVGFQPDGIAVSGNRLYVANSGGYRVPNYERTLSVIDLDRFEVVKTVELGINLSQVAADSKGRIWVASRGDYYDVMSCLYCYDPTADKVVKIIERPVSAMTLSADTLFCVANAWSYETMSNVTEQFMVDVTTGDIVDRPIIAPDVAERIRVPYGIAVNPKTRERFVTDAGNYVNPGRLFALDPQGNLKWEVRTGDVPAVIAFF